MKRVKTLQNDDADEVETAIEDWVNKEKPEIISISTIPGSDTTYPMIIILYDDRVVEL